MKKSTITIEVTQPNGTTSVKYAHGYAWHWQGFDFTVHRPSDPRIGFFSDGWVMSENSTGRSVTRSLKFKTREKAIKAVRLWCEHLGVERLDRAVSAVLNERRDNLHK